MNDRCGSNAVKVLSHLLQKKYFDRMQTLLTVISLFFVLSARAHAHQTNKLVLIQFEIRIVASQSLNDNGPLKVYIQFQYKISVIFRKPARIFSLDSPKH